LDYLRKKYFSIDYECFRGAFAVQSKIYFFFMVSAYFGIVAPEQQHAVRVTLNLYRKI
jgi:hypothetical protein